MLYNTTNGQHQRSSSQQVVEVVQHVRSRLNLLYNISPATDILYNTTNGRAHNSSTTCCTTNSPPTDKICHIPTSWHVEMLGSGIAMWQICCTTSCRIVAILSVGGVVQHVRSRCPCSGVWHLDDKCALCLSSSGNSSFGLSVRSAHSLQRVLKPS